MLLRLLLIFIAVIPLVGQAPPPFEPGEKLIYTARFNILPVGEATLTVLNEEVFDSNPAYHVVYQAQTGEMADRLFKIRDRIDIWFDKDRIFTYQLKKDLHEGKYRHKSLTTFHYEDSLAIVGKDTIEIYEPVKDPYTLMYYLRSLPLEVGQTLDLITFDNKKQTDFQVKITGRERLQVPAGVYSCLVVKPFRDKRTLFKYEGDMEIWLTNDEQRIPVQIHIKLKFGTLVLKLKEVAKAS